MTVRSSSIVAERYGDSQGLYRLNLSLQDFNDFSVSPVGIADAEHSFRFPASMASRE
jgi:hypothetical protein